MDIKTCPICLDEIEEGMITKKLSCNCKQEYHFACFKQMVYKKGNFFIKCPLCRTKNTNVDYPTEDSKENILLMLHTALSKNIKCNHKTKSGNKCKLKPIMLNYGCCHVHNSEILPKENYELFSKWLYHILQTNYKWISILYLLDFGKKIIIHKLNNKNKVYGVESILHYLYTYINIHIDEINSINKPYMEGIYDYFKLEKPCQKWLRYCLDNRTII